MHLDQLAASEVVEGTMDRAHLDLLTASRPTCTSLATKTRLHSATTLRAWLP